MNIKIINPITIHHNATGAVEVQLNTGEAWLTKIQLAQLFGCNLCVVEKHLNSVFREMDKKSNTKHLSIPGFDNPMCHYGLDVTIALSYRVKSTKGVEFRIWATRMLRERLVSSNACGHESLPAKDTDPVPADELNTNADSGLAIPRKKM